MKKFFAILLAAMMVVSMFAACASSEGGNDSDTSKGGNAIKIGMTGPLTGDAAQYGTAVEAGIEIAVEEINAAAGEDGLKIEFQSEDDEADGEKAVSGYKILKDWGMQVFIGTVTSGACNAVAPETVEDEIFLLTPSASAVEVATAGANTYQMCFTDPNQGASAAEVVNGNWNDAAIGIIYDSSDDYSTGLYEGFKAKASELGLNVVCETSFTKDTKADLTTQVTMCKDNGATLVFLPIYYSEASQILMIADRNSYDPTFFGCDGMDGILNVEGFDKSLAEGLALMTPFDANATDEATQSFVAKYKEKMDGQVPNQFAADAYDCVYAVYNACVEAGVDGSTAPADVCAALIKEFNSMTFDGLTGKGMTWDEEGMISKAPAAVVITDGVYVPMG
ncbi:MAG: ABC transporter substrate-binding protein [Oscillospiraceae bacterium]|nr:ABC transporter substrate-binding protein [Oscillospiraceae bacterium]